MTIQHIRNGRLLSQQTEEFAEHSIVVQRYEGGLNIAQGDSSIYVEESHVAEFLKAVRDVAKETP